MSQKRSGRPRAFEKADALTQAMHVFWAKGYDGASMKDLTQAMGINSPSLYSAFGDKAALYAKTIDAYVENDACAPLVAFEQEPDINKAVHAFLNAVVEYATNQPGGNRGCYLSSCVATNAQEMDGISDQLQRAIRETDARLAERFAAEMAAGKLTGTATPMERAQMMFDLRQGVVFRARAGISSSEILSGFDHKVASILG